MARKTLGRMAPGGGGETKKGQPTIDKQQPKMSSTIGSKDIDQEQLQEFIVGDRFRVTTEMLMVVVAATAATQVSQKKSGNGGCRRRHIRLGEDLYDKNRKVAVKLEPLEPPSVSGPETAADVLPPHLHIEYRIYKMLADKPGVPRIFYFGHIEQKFQVLVMELLGPNLEQLFDLCQRQFSLKTTLFAAIEMLTRLHTVHEQGIVHRDIKPENFLLGCAHSFTHRLVYVVGFGLAKQYGHNGGHRQRMTCRHFPMGPVRYMSIAAHQGLEQTPRDDLESLAYVLAYFLRQGRLPWTGLDQDQSGGGGRGSLKRLNQKVCEYKMSIPIETLFHGFPNEFANFLRYVRTLEMDSEPDYYYMTQLFNELFKRERFFADGNYDWTNKIGGGTTRF